MSRQRAFRAPPGVVQVLSGGRDRYDAFGERQAHALRDDRARAEPAGADLREFFGILARHRFFIGCMAAGALGLAAAYLLIVAGTAYTATVSILIDARGRGPIGTEQQPSASATPDATLVESQVKLIASDTVLRRVAQSERLAEDPEFLSSQPGLRTRLFSLLGVGSAAPAGGEDKLSRATAALSRALTVKRSERTYVMDVDLSSANPVKAARLANLVAEAYIADQRDARSQISRQDSKWLNQRLVELQAKLQEAENKVQEYRVKNRITDAVGKNVREQELSDLTNELGRARSRTIEAKAKLDQVQRLAASGRLPDGTTDALKSPVLEKLRTQYADIARQEAHYRTTLGDRHPAMLEVQSQLRDSRRLIAAELKRVADSAGNEYQQARAAETATGLRTETARLSTDSKNGNMVELRELDRELEAHRTAYEKFLKARESMADDSGDGLLARIIAPAVPPLAPSSPKSAAILFISLLSGLSLGIGTALLREYLGGSGGGASASAGEPGPARREPSFGRAAGLHILASVPRAGAGAAAGMSRLKHWISSTDAKRGRADLSPGGLLAETCNHPQSPFSQAIRLLLEPLGLRGGARAARMTAVLVTSMRERCGKTTIAVNLARAAALQGRRALIIDAGAEGGLLPLIEAGAEPALIALDGVLRPLYRVSGAGPGELRFVPLLADEERLCARLARQRSTPRFSGIEGNFDFVVIDGPAMGLGDEARFLAGAVDHIVLVAAPGETLPSADAIMETLDVTRGKLAGGVESMAAPRKAA